MKIKKKNFTNISLVIVEAVKNGHLEIIKWLYEKNGSIKYNTNVIHLAAANGHLEILKFFYEHIIDGIKPNKLAIDKAAKNGHLNCIQYLMEKGAECPMNVMDTAAENGHLEIVKWLYKNIKNKVICSTNAMDLAAANGHLDVIKWLHKNMPITPICTELAFNNAAKYGYLDITKWFYKHEYKYSKNIIDWPVCNGHFATVKWIYNNLKDIENIEKTLSYAKRNGFMVITRWLQKNVVKNEI